MLDGESPEFFNQRRDRDDLRATSTFLGGDGERCRDRRREPSSRADPTITACATVAAAPFGDG